MNAFELGKSKSRILTALLCSTATATLMISIINDQGSRESPNIVAVVIACISFIATFGLLNYALIYWISDSLTKFIFLPDGIIIQKKFKKRVETISYSNITKIRVRVPLWGNFPKEHYANFKISTANKTYELEAVKNWENLLIFLFDESSKASTIKIENLVADDLTALIFSQTIQNLQKLKTQ